MQTSNLQHQFLLRAKSGFLQTIKRQNSSAVANMPSANKTGHSVSPEYKIVTSTLRRTIETSRLLFSKEHDLSDSSICEVPIKAFTTSKIILQKIVWDVIARVQWRLNSERQPESHVESKARVNRFIEKVLLKDENLIIVSHGWIIKLMIKRL